MVAGAEGPADRPGAGSGRPFRVGGSRRLWRAAASRPADVATARH